METTTLARERLPRTVAVVGATLLALAATIWYTGSEEWILIEQIAAVLIVLIVAAIVSDRIVVR